MNDYHNSVRHFLLWITACGNYEMDQSLYRCRILIQKKWKSKWSALVLLFPRVKTNRVHICCNFPAGMMNLLLYIPAGFLILDTRSHFRNRPLRLPPLSSALLCLAPVHTTDTNTNRPTPVAGLKELPLISAVLYIFLIRKWNTTLSHSLKSTKANYPSFAQVPVGQESPIYLDPDVSMSQAGR